jgi:hypothetical protein
MPLRKQLPHILLRDAAKAEEYSYPGRGGGAVDLPVRDRASHAARLEARLEQARTEAHERSERQAQAWAVPAKRGVHLELESEPGFELALKSLEDARQGIELVSVRESAVAKGEDKERLTLATVYVPAGKLEILEKKIHEYATANTKAGKPRHEKLLAAIADLRLATLRSFWTDQPNLFPGAGENLWWEIWLRSADRVVEESFRVSMKALGLLVRGESLEFLETRVLLGYGSPEQLTASIEVVDAIAELRRAKEAASFFMEMPRRDLGPWVDDLASRTESPAESSPRLCVHDTGVNAGHPLLEAALRQADCHAVDPEWQLHDHHGHGTGIAGLALYGDLTEALASSLSYRLPARLESVKILPPPPGLNEPELYGRTSEQAVYRVEVQAPSVQRTHVMAVTATDGRERGKPSSWSAAVDQLAFGKDDEPKRLWVLAAGNSPEEAWGAHPDHLETEEIHDPGQAWNVLTVGACTSRWQIDEDDFSGWVPLARPGGLGPSTSTSLTWDSKWPLKPDVVAEGGNAARSQIGQVDLPDSLRLLTTHYRPAERLLTTFGETSAASALVARIASTLWSRYPGYWPETVRALIVHSARWTREMQERYGPLISKGAYERLIRRCGFGVPSLEEALWSAENRLTLVTQEAIQPYIRKRNESGQSSTNLKELHLYALPWPVEQLRDLGETEVELRVTLSYFIEPNPSERGYQYRHRYASHGLRFDVRGATESPSEFRKRLNKAARAEGERSPSTGDSSGWLVGSDSRHKGSIHSDIWRGPAIDLANRQHLAVFPVSGWWKERHSLERWKRRARYSLIVSIHAPEIEVDLYTPVSNQVGIAIEV